MDVTPHGSKVQCYKEQNCIGTWNVRSMNQGKLEVVKQEMATVNVDILGINKLKWTGMGEFNSDDHYIYYCVVAACRIFSCGLCDLLSQSGVEPGPLHGKCGVLATGPKGSPCFRMF